MSDDVFGGGTNGLRRTFTVMLIPLAASSALLFKAARSYPGDVAVAAASQQRSESWNPPNSDVGITAS
jgi:hypothetical protein